MSTSLPGARAITAPPRRARPARARLDDAEHAGHRFERRARAASARGDEHLHVRPGVPRRVRRAARRREAPRTASSTSSVTARSSARRPRTRDACIASALRSVSSPTRRRSPRQERALHLVEDPRGVDEPRRRSTGSPSPCGSSHRGTTRPSASLVTTQTSTRTSSASAAPRGAPRAPRPRASLGARAQVRRSRRRGSAPRSPSLAAPHR